MSAENIGPSISHPTPPPLTSGHQCPTPPFVRASPQCNLFASACAASISTVAVQPLDVLKTRLQVRSIARHEQKPSLSISKNLRCIFNHEGVRGLYRGLFPSLISVVPSISLYFTLYCEMKRTLFSLPHNANSPAQVAMLQSASAGLASCATAAITNPLWVVKTRMQTQPTYAPKYGNTVHAVRSIVKEEGARGLYKGLGASFMNCSQAMIQFPLYESLKRLMCSKYNTRDTPHEAAMCYLASSSISSSLSCIATYPSEVVRSRMQIQGMQLPTQGPCPHVNKQFPRPYSGTFNAFKTIWRDEGIHGLYRGMFTNLIRIVPAHAISFTAYEVILRFWCY